MVPFMALQSYTKGSRRFKDGELRTTGAQPVLPAVFAVIGRFFRYAVVQIVLVLTSGIERGLIKIFQWMLFLIVALFGALGVALG